MKRDLFSLVVVITIAVAYATLGQSRSGQPPAQSRPSKDKLHEMAKKSGGRFVLRYRPTGNVFSDLHELGKKSDAVIIGRVLAHRPHLTPSGNLITNDYLVKIVEVIKGDLPNRRSITVKVPGGAYKFPDGTYATVLTNGYRQPEDRLIYVFFLKARPNSDEYRLVSESQGAFALKTEGVEPADLDATHPVVTNYRGLSPVEFLRQLHKEVPLQKRPITAQKSAR